MASSGTYRTVLINAANSGNNEIVAAIAGTSIRVVSLFFVVAALAVCTFNDGTNNLTGAMSYGQYGGISMPFNQIGWFTGGAGRPLNLNLGGAYQVSGALTYMEA